MMAKPKKKKQKKSWGYWREVFNTAKSKDAGAGITLKDFCKENSLIYETARRAFKRLENTPVKKAEIPITTEQAAPVKKKKGHKRHDWSAYKIEFLKGDFKTVSDFARAKGISLRGRNLSQRTKGWSAEKAEIGREAAIQAAADVSDLTVARLHGEMIAALNDAIRLLQAAREKHSDVSKWVDGPLDLKFLIGCADDTLKVAERFVPFLQKIIGSKESLKILEKFRTGEINVIDACLQLEILGVPLPQTLKITLSKQQPDDGDITPGGPIPSDEELEAIYREGLAKIEREESFFVPARKKEVEQLKKDAKQSGSYGGQGDGEKEIKGEDSNGNR